MNVLSSQITPFSALISGKSLQCRELAEALGPAAELVERRGRVCSAVSWPKISGEQNVTKGSSSLGPETRRLLVSRHEPRAWDPSACW